MVVNYCNRSMKRITTTWFDRLQRNREQRGAYFRLLLSKVMSINAEVLAITRTVDVTRTKRMYVNWPFLNLPLTTPAFLRHSDVKHTWDPSLAVSNGDS